MLENYAECAASEHITTTGFSFSRNHEIQTVVLCRNSLLRMGLKHLLTGTRFAVCETDFAIAALSQEVRSLTPELFLVDVSSCSEEELKTVSILKAHFPQARIIAFADTFDLGFVRLGLEAGVNGYCLFTSDREVLIKSLELAMLGEIILPTVLVQSAFQQLAPFLEQGAIGQSSEPKATSPAAHKLSPREAEILGCIMGGAPNKIIARQLDVTEATVKVHVKAILRKVGAANRTQAAMWATEHLGTGGKQVLHA
ncbi:response regulator transcription factor [Microvirga aerilata]|uniref:Response regulator transcription factor n=1 Tax=Microvirga aerilata TaxID=670292 RepID=A0A937D012_9HYPH|nr:response regulator transcription factor [Microvirga aerilata]MBL0407294.1 response regulator transcription factor [Microvirga aerilata]